MPSKTLRVAVTAAVAGAVSLGTIGSAQAAGSHKSDTIKIGWTSWSDAQFVAHLVKTLVEKKTHHKVDLKKAAIGVQYKSVEKGDLDGMIMSWLPDTHRSYIKKVGNKIHDIGILYGGAKLGWVVPDYVPKSKLNSIKDLHKKSVRSKLDGKIQGIDPGAGLMQLSGKAMKAYDLKKHYRLKKASGSAMTAALKRAEQQHKWIVVTGWTPHWMFGKWKLRFMKDPKGALGKAQHVDFQVRKGFKKDHPRLARVFSRMHLNLSNLQAAMYDARKTSEKKAIDKYIKAHKATIDSWFYTNKKEKKSS
jgi:glycine betaine/proline transport system substrate-binding protein